MDPTHSLDDIARKIVQTDPSNYTFGIPMVMLSSSRN